MSNNDTFITKKVTNKHIYDEIGNLKEMLREHKKATDGGFIAVKQKQDKTNGKVKLAMWIGTTALSLVASILMGLAIKLLGSL